MDPILHRARDRGSFKNQWLDTNYSFSFSEYYDPKKMGFGALRVLNDDVVAPHQGFATHPHKDMEIVTLVRKGVLTHEDSLGSKGTISSGEIQHMSAGTGVYHSEVNAGDVPVELFQIWILPKKTGIVPKYSQRKVYSSLLVSPDGRDGSLAMNQDAFISLRKIQGLYSYRRYYEDSLVYLFVVEGLALIAGFDVGPRDAVGVGDDVDIKGDAEVLIIEVPALSSLE